MENILEHGRDMRRITLEGILQMAIVYKETNGSIEDFIDYLEEKVAEEKTINEQDCE